MTETTDAPQVIDEAFLRSIEMERKRARFHAESARAKVIAAERDARDAEQDAADLDRVYEHMSARVGQTLEQVMAEAERRVEELGASLPGLAAAVADAQVEARDWEGYARIKWRELDKIKAQYEAERAEKGLCPECGQPVAKGEP